jgi:hypothetical protein
MSGFQVGAKLKIAGKNKARGGAERERFFSRKILFAGRGDELFQSFTPGSFSGGARFLVSKEKNLERLPMRNPNLFFACF